MKVVVWGCGQVAMRLLDTELKNVNIEYVIDNNPEKLFQSMRLYHQLRQLSGNTT